MGKLDTLAAQGDTVRIALTEQKLGEVADLMLRLHQQTAREKGAILPDHMMRSYLQRSDSERAGMRSAVGHALVALVLLGYIEAPEL
jgi:hypothetical protein